MPGVPSKDHARQLRALWPDLRAAIDRALLEDDPILGRSVAQLEAALARAHDVRFAAGVASGMAALELALVELGAGPGDEVVTGAHTFTGVITAIVLTGATPVLVDVDPATGLLDAGAAAAAIGPRTRVVLPVHMYGHPVDATAFAALGVPVLEDVSQAHGATWRGRPVGSFGAAAAMSFHPSKNLGAFGDGGAVLTNDPALDDRIRVARNLGKSGKYAFTRVARNEKLDTLQAAILEVKLRHLPAWIERRRALAARYLEGLRGAGDLLLPDEHPDARHAYHLFVVRTARRDRLKDFLAARGIKAGLHYPVAAHHQPAHAARFAGQRFPVAERWAAEVLTLPLSHEHEDDEIDQVIEATRSFFR